jgi:hypothetical protein
MTATQNIDSSVFQGEEEFDGKPPRTVKLKTFFVSLLAVVALSALSLFLVLTHHNSQRLETERATAERELRAYAELNDLPIREITVEWSDYKLYASWQEGNQQCSGIEVIPPSNGSSLYGTQQSAVGDGNCRSETGTAGINSPSD